LRSDRLVQRSNPPGTDATSRAHSHSARFCADVHSHWTIGVEDVRKGIRGRRPQRPPASSKRAEAAAREGRTATVALPATAQIVNLPSSLSEAMDALRSDHEFLLDGAVFTGDLMEE